MKNPTTTSVLVIILLCANFFTLLAQEKNQKVTQNLASLIDKSSTFKNYKVIDKEALSNFQFVLNSYIQSEHNLKESLHSKLKSDSAEILSLQQQINHLQALNKEIQAEKANIGFLGFQIGKTTYSIVMWTLLLGSLVLTSLFYLKFKRANEVTKSSKSVLRDLEDEYESFRRVCIEREQSLRRQLFNEIKKMNELRNAS